MLNKIISK